MRKVKDNSADAPVCPNNSRHGLRPDARGGYVCDSCVEEFTGTRTRAATRWAFARVGVDAETDTE
jgi:ribosomal protein L37AE/L43A